MKQEGAYSLLEPEELGDPLAELDEEFGEIDFLDSRVSTYSSVDTAYNGALMIVADEKLGRSEKEDIIDRLTEDYGGKADNLFLRKEGSSSEGFYYSVADTLARDNLDAS